MNRIRYRQRHTAAGMCISCPNPADPGNLMCHSCRQKNIKRCIKKNSKYRAIYEATGRCMSCSAPLDEHENKLCINCIERCSRRSREARGYIERA